MVFMDGHTIWDTREWLCMLSQRILRNDGMITFKSVLICFYGEASRMRLGMQKVAGQKPKALYE
jgi:hypothetical protein